MDEELQNELQEAKEMKINHLKKCRDYYETFPVSYNGSNYDFDEKSYQRITAAIYVLSGGGTIAWTTADNTVVNVTATDLMNVIAQAAIRSDQLHRKCRIYKNAVNNAQSVAEVEAINWVV